MKTKTILATFAVAATSAWQAKAQTNASAVTSTNLITAASHFREVDGQLYNTEQSYLWSDHSGKCVRVSPVGIVIETYKEKPIYQTGTKSRATHNWLGGISGYRTVGTVEKVGTEKIPDMRYFLRNYPAARKAAVGETISFRAMRVGVTNCGKDTLNDTLAVLDYGTPHVVSVVSTNYGLADTLGNRKSLASENQTNRAAQESTSAKKQAAQVKALKWNEEQASKGDAFGLLRMGERYRDGDGVPRDLTKAREYLIKAVAAGSPTAADALSRLNQISPNAPAKQ